MDIIQKLTNLFSDFPTVGPRTAQRFVYYLMKQSKERIEEITNAILECFILFLPNSDYIRSFIR